MKVGSIDRKYDGSLCKVATGEEVKDFVVFRARDNQLPALLIMYRVLCEYDGCDEEHLQSIEILKDNVRIWRERHPGLCHVPDTLLSELGAKLMED